MEENTSKIKQLEDRLDSLINKQAGLIEEANGLRQAINSIRNTEAEKQDETPAQPIKKQVQNIAEPVKQAVRTPIVVTKPDLASSDKVYSNLNIEKFIGENLINKIGILITIIGVAIGAKYSIENELISPTTRIILGYIMGIGLLGFGMKLKAKYESLSAVLVSGAMTILYFITYLGYSTYELFPQLPAFGLMLLFTAFTVYAAINYNRQIIAILGLVGAYAVPFLLSTGSGRVDILFSYIALINIGILFVSLRKYWKPVYYSAFAMTWLIYAGWYIADYSEQTHFTLALVFLAIFYLIFYATFIGYKMKHKKSLGFADVVMILLNSFLFYGIGYYTIAENYQTEHLVGAFTLINAAIHFAVSTTIYKLKLADKSIFFMLSGLVLVFITIAIPVQLDGNWVTLLWVGEAALLFWIGRTKNVPLYEYISYALMALATFSLFEDWGHFYSNNSLQVGYDSETQVNTFTPIFNIQFLNTTLFLAGFIFIHFINSKKEFVSEKVKSSQFFDLLKWGVPILILGTLYLSFFSEIAMYWSQRFENTIIDNSEGYFRNLDLRHFKTIWLINYSIVFVGILSIFNIKKFKSDILAKVNLVINAATLLAFLSLGLYAISELRETYIGQSDAKFYTHGWFNLGIRYVSISLFAALMYICYRYIKESFIVGSLRKAFDVAFHISLLWILSSELLSIMSLGGVANNYKLGLSILWGVYSLTLVAYGIYKNNAFLRVGAIILFGVTLVKLFFYDISHLDTIAKTIVFVSLGILLLIISYLYNRFKNEISNTEDEKIS
ncbi:MAG: putative membrane protein [Bacteroidia bacterium]|jgi:uncharacterized membrane protein